MDAMKKARVVYASTNQNSDALYMVRTHAPDPFLLVELEGERIGLFNAMEQNRMKRESAIGTVLALEDYVAKARAAYGPEAGNPGDLMAIVAQEHGIERYLAGADFPAQVLRQAEKRGLKIDVADEALFPERRVKDDREAAEIRKGNEAACAGFDAVEKMLAAAEIANDGTLLLDGEPLTSERVRAEINVACIRRGAWAMETILAGGEQACDPHCEGTGPLHANELIVADIFPRLDATGYFGDMTRTYLKGTPSAEQKRLVETVARGQKLALERIHAGADGRAIHWAVADFFTAEGYPTEKRNGRYVGFFHGLGHCVGLDIHELPRMNRTGSLLAAGNVITVEPGLYYPGLGGCRIEDVVRVTDSGCESLSSHPCGWVLP